MESPSTPSDARLQALIALKEHLQELHAKLEYVRLLLRLRGPAA